MKTAEEWFREGLRSLAMTNEMSSVDNANNMDDALEAFDQVLAIDPRHLGAIRERGQILWAFGRHEEALDALITVKTQSPPDAVLSTSAGNALMKLGQPEAALAAFDEALAILPGDLEAMVGRADALMKLERNELALAAWDQLLARPDQTFRQWPDYLVRCTRTLMRASALARLQRPEAFDTLVELFRKEASYLKYVPAFEEVLREHEVARLALAGLPAQNTGG